MTIEALWAYDEYQHSLEESNQNSSQEPRNAEIPIDKIPGDFTLESFAGLCWSGVGYASKPENRQYAIYISNLVQALAS